MVDIYNRILKILQEDIINSDLDIFLLPSQWDTIAEVVTDEIEIILTEKESKLIEGLEELIEGLQL